jgi:serine phosphatase RsbU (regulator of sigma subunit)/anti-sigma regulatory factor (Ser/Thr protein kinase)
MKENVADLYQLLTKTWKGMTSGEFFLIPSGAVLHEVIKGKEIPEEIVHAHKRGEDLQHLILGERRWWLIKTVMEEERASYLLAWAESDGSWDKVLLTWAKLFSHASVEERVSADLSAELVRAWDRLTFLYELTKIAGRSSDISEMLESIVASLGHVIESGDVFLAIEGDEGQVSVISSGRKIDFPFPSFERLKAIQRPISLEEIRELDYREYNPYKDVSDLIIAPLLTSEGVYGLLGFINAEGGNYDANDAGLLSSVGEHIGALIEASQARKAREEREQLERELSIAAEIQSNLLPVRLPELEGCEVYAHLRPARRIGGDFYDVAHARTGEPILMLADVAGKGMPAAILTAVVHATFHGETPYQRDPAQLLSEINRSIYPDLDKAQAFVTAAVSRIDTKPLSIAYASAGHVEAALWHRRTGWIEFLPATGLPLGVQQFLSCRTKSFNLEPGDVLLLYSDGVTEAENLRGEVFGAQGLSDIMEAIYPASANEQISVILEAVEFFCDGLTFRDDLTLVMLKVSDDEEQYLNVIPFVLPSKTSYIGPFIEQTSEKIAPYVPEKYEIGLVDEFMLALSEVITNQAEHAYQYKAGLIVGRLTLSESRWQANLIDRGIGFDSDTTTEFPINTDDPPIHGYGLRIMHSLLDNCTYERLKDGRNHWTLTKNLSGEGME